VLFANLLEHFPPASENGVSHMRNCSSNSELLDQIRIARATPNCSILSELLDTFRKISSRSSSSEMVVIKLGMEMTTKYTPNCSSNSELLGTFRKISSGLSSSQMVCNKTWNGNHHRIAYSMVFFQTSVGWRVVWVVIIMAAEDRKCSSDSLEQFARAILSGFVKAPVTLLGKLLLTFR
jgi:hypothetical protein